MTMQELIIPKGAYNILQRLTGESRPDLALSLALKDLVRLRLESVQSRIAGFEQKYGMTFAKFEKAWQSGKVKESHSYPVEQDYLQWEAAATDLDALREISEWQA